MHVGGDMVGDKLFPYPISETLKIGTEDPLDYRYTASGMVYEPGWWRGTTEVQAGASKVSAAAKKGVDK